MSRTSGLAARALALALAAGAAAAADATAGCAPAIPAGAQRPLPRGKVDRALLTRAVLADANAARCAHGRAALAPSPALARAGAAHSRRMAQHRRLAHGAGAQGLARRLARAGVAHARAAENLGALYRYPVDRGPVRVRDRAHCRFSRGGRLLAPRSYARLARDIVALWLASPAHRRNLLAPRLRRAGAGAVFAPAPRYCGRYWVTLLLAG